MLVFQTNLVMEILTKFWSRQKFHHSLKEHHKISNIPEFRCEPFPVRNTKWLKKRQTSQGYIIRILQHFEILLILWRSFKLWWNFCLDQNLDLLIWNANMAAVTSCKRCTKADSHSLQNVVRSTFCNRFLLKYKQSSGTNLISCTGLLMHISIFI